LVKSRIALVAGLLTFGVASSHAAWFTTEASFLAAIQATYYAEDAFTGAGGSTSWTAPGGNGYGFTVSATSNLASVPSGVRTTNSANPLTWSFSPPVTAFGGYFGTYRTSGTPGLIAGTVTMTVGSDSQSVSTGTGSTVFIGWVGNIALSASNTAITGNLQTENDFVMADKVILGSQQVNTVPEPFTMGLGIAAAGVFVRRRRKK